MEKGIRKCISCGEEYKFCLHCAEYDHLPRWKNMWHNENCKNLFNIASEYSVKNISAEEAKERFSKCDLSYKNKLHKNIVKAINEVNKLTKKAASKKEKEVSEVVNVVEEKEFE